MGIAKSLFGTLRWTPPKWLEALGARRAGLGILGLAVVAALAAGGHWYLASRPQAAQVVVQIEAPGATPIVEGELRPEALLLNFSVRADPRHPTGAAASIARLDLLGEVVKEGISIEPAIPGQWRWASETQLRFSPRQDWPAGQTYTVRYEDSVFAPLLRLEANTARFKTIDFRADISALEFYPSPVQRGLRQVVATLDFSHPVDRASLERRVQYRLRAPDATIESPGQRVDFDIRYGPLGRRAYIHSVPIDLAPREQFMSLQVSRGVEPATGSSRLADALAQDLRIPDLGSYFRITQIDTLTARDDNEDDVQTLSIEFSDRVRRDALQERISAYLLPADQVVENATQTDYAWQSPREVTPAVLRESERLDLRLSAVEGDSAARHSAALDLPQGRYLYLKIDAGLESEGGFVLARPYDTVARAPDYTRQAEVAQSGAVLPLAGSQRLSFVSRGVQTLRVELARLLDEDIHHLASQTAGDIRSAYFNNYRFNEDNITARTTRFIDLNPEHPGRATYSSVDLGDGLADGGFYFVTVQGWDRAGEQPVGDSDRRFVLISDIGLLVKTNADSSHDVFVHSIASGQPLSGARIALLGKNGIPIIERRSSDQGHAALPPTRAFEREKTPTVFVVKHGQDTLFMPYARRGRRLQYSRFDVGGDYVQPHPEGQRLRAQLFTERGIYRPGELVHIASIVKREDWEGLDKLPLVLQITCRTSVSSTRPSQPKPYRPREATTPRSISSMTTPIGAPSAAPRSRSRNSCPTGCASAAEFAARRPGDGSSRTRWSPKSIWTISSERPPRRGVSPASSPSGPRRFNSPPTKGLSFPTRCAGPTRPCRPLRKPWRTPARTRAGAPNCPST